MNQYYIQLNNSVKKHPKLVGLLKYYKYLSYIIVMMYGYLLVVTVIHYHFNFIGFIEDPIFYKPLITLIIVSLLRKLFNRPRPFEVYHFNPIVQHTNGESWPSRHSSSSLIIALMFFPEYPLLFVFGILITLLISCSRILLGVHFIKDILSAYLIALIIFII